MIRIYAVLIVFVLMLSGTVVVSAQSGGGYDLSWSTVDGGGHTWSTGGGYSLGGAIGQADAQAPASGGGYNLQGGFWHRACAPQPVAVMLTCNGTTLTLTWTPDAANMAYDIYRSDSPYFAVEQTLKVGTVTGSSWDHVGGCGSAATNFYYLVRGVCIGAHADANDCGEFDFGLVPGS